ncbi:MAG: protein kinase [Planctomycetota bacterium]|nr:protein kinase [Planctomycetota bacterium]
MADQDRTPPPPSDPDAETLDAETQDAVTLDPVGGDSERPPGGSMYDLDSIGPYQIVRPLGEGGFGVVYLAHQESPLRRDVAIKVVRAGIGNQRVLARFEAERQALALMSHPGIAKVIDAGTTESGLPFFVMEFVDGMPIDEFCDEHDLDVAARIRLFIDVCEAIQHAHAKGVIHRDLKPGNIIVGMDRDSCIPRVIDFGIAKALEADLLGTDVQTVEGQFIGTPHYMAPEQTGFTGQDVDVRADVYSLGAVLYELLVGRVVVDSDTIRRAREQSGLSGLQKLLCEREVMYGSARFREIMVDDPELACSIASHRGTDPRGLTRQLLGDLDWIMAKSLERDRDRRYATPISLAEDLTRHLQLEPVLAGPPGRLYRAGKFVRRNRIGVASLVSIFMIMLLAFLYSNSKRLAAERAARETESTLAFVEASLGGLDPSYGGGRDLLAIDFFDAGYESVVSDESLEPRVRVRLYALYSSIFFTLGEYLEAANSARRGLDLLDATPGRGVEFDSDSLRYLLAQALQGQGNQSDVLTMLSSLEEDTPETHGIRAYALHNAGDYEGALVHYRQQVRKLERAGPSFQLAEALDFQGRLLVDDGLIEEGESLILQASDLRSALSEVEGSAVAMSLLSRGYAMLGRNRYGEALDLYAQAHDLYAEMHGDDSTFMVELCRLEIDGVLADASLFDLDLVIDIPASDPGPEMGFMDAMNKRNRARFLHAAGASDSALELLEESLAVGQLDTGFRAHTLMTRARILIDLNRLALAEADLHEALGLVEGDGLADSPGEAPIRMLMAELFLRLGRLEEARNQVPRLEELRAPFIGDSPPRKSLDDLRERLDAAG